MRLNRWVYVASSVGFVAGGLAEQACTPTNYCTGSGASEICYVYTPVLAAAGGSSSGSSAPPPVDAGADALANLVPWAAGDGGSCGGPVGGYPLVSCDPSDDSNCSTTGVPAGCTIAPICGNPNTCEPFVNNPPLPTFADGGVLADGGTPGVDNFRMRLINITAPPALSNEVVQGSIVTNAVDLSVTDAGDSCGENGVGLFNWMLSVTKTSATTGTVVTGGAPASTDPFKLGYCYVNTTIQGFQVGPINLTATFTGPNTFNTNAYADTLRIPIFIAGGGVVLLPIHAAAFNDVTITNDGNCIGAVNNASIAASATGPCTDSNPNGVDSCARWHTAGSLGGYILLSEADKVPVVTLGNESLCVLLTSDMTTASPPTCTAQGLSAGNYCSTTHSACSNGDSVWLSAQFAASAVNITKGAGIPACNGGDAG